MRDFTAGSGASSNSAVDAYLAGTNQYVFPKLFIIGHADDPAAIFLTDHESPLQYNIYPGITFQPASVRRGSIKAAIGLETTSVSLDWTPSNMVFTQVASTASPLQLAMLGYYDNWPVTMYTAIMKPGGDINTLGACVDFKGRIADIQVDRSGIKFVVNSLMDIINTQQVPTNVIRNTSTQIAYTGAVPPAGETNGVPNFTTFMGSNTTKVYGDALSPYSAHHIFGTNKFQRGFLVFLPGPGATLERFFSAIASSGDFFDGTLHHNQFVLYSTLPWAPTPWTGSAGDTFYVSATPPVDASEGADDVFSYVPNPESAA